MLWLGVYRLLRICVPVSLGFVIGASLSLFLFPLIYEQAQFIDNCGLADIGIKIGQFADSFRPIYKHATVFQQSWVLAT